ncbi:MAG: amidoligase family protein [Clostridia bacterium]|nr:amidoligase family protein [Clostridia bacterium]
MITIQNQNFGVEIELTGITRSDAAKIIAKHYDTQRVEAGYDYYHSCYAVDTKGRKWRCMSDGSINCQMKHNGNIVRASGEYSCEVVTPILQYDDLNDLQEIVRKLRAAGAIANSSCGIHVHVDGANHTPESLTRLLNFAVGRQDLFYEALQIGDRANHWCHKTNRTLLNAMKHDDQRTKQSAERIWYSLVNDGYTGGISHEHYNATRYHGINLHAFFTKGTVEFRLFNGTTHAGKIKAYVQFCLAMSAWSINCENNNLYFKGIAGYTDEQKAAIMKRVLINRLGLSGPEYKTCRIHLTNVWNHAADTDAA